jgi:hypothetical protein
MPRLTALLPLRPPKILSRKNTPSAARLWADRGRTCPQAGLIHENHESTHKKDESTHPKPESTHENVEFTQENHESTQEKDGLTQQNAESTQEKHESIQQNDESTHCFIESVQEWGNSGGGPQVVGLSGVVFLRGPAEKRVLTVFK